MKILTTNQPAIPADKTPVVPAPQTGGPAPEDIQRLQEALQALQSRVAKWGQEWPALLEKQLSSMNISTPATGETPGKWQESIGKMEERLKACEQAAAEMAQRITTDMERFLKPSLDELEQKWTSVAQEWNTQLQGNSDKIQALQQRIQKLQETPAPLAAEPSPGKAPDMSVVFPEPENAPKPSLWSRLWGYLNEPAIEIAPKSKRS